MHIAAAKGELGEPWLIDRGLNIHAEIHQVRHKLRVRLGLVPASHDAESHADAILFHKCRNDGMEGPLVRSERVRRARIETEIRPAVMQWKAGMPRNKTGPETRR